MQTARTVALEIQQAQQKLDELTTWRAQLLAVAAGNLDSTADDAQISRLNLQVQALETRLKTLKEAHFQASAADMLASYRDAQQAAFDAAQRRIQVKDALDELQADYEAKLKAARLDFQRAEQAASSARDTVKTFLQDAAEVNPYGDKLTQAIEPQARGIARQFDELTAEAARKRREAREAKAAAEREARTAPGRAEREAARQRILDRQAEREARQAAFYGQTKRRPAPPLRMPVPGD